MNPTNTMTPIPSNTILIDSGNQRWELLEIIGMGGFGLIYATKKLDPCPDKDSYIIKLEYSSSGALFTEINFYTRTMRHEQPINEWLQKNNLTYLGVPRYFGFGLTTINGLNYRFLVLERLGNDLSYYLQKLGRFNIRGIIKIAIQVLVALEYIHTNGFIHGDIKASNILFSVDNSKIYLVDYGIANRFLINGKHREYNIDPKRKHDGTLFYTSIDAHKGAYASRRSDLESLGYCMLEWLQGVLPWTKYKGNPSYVEMSKTLLIDRLHKKEMSSINKRAIIFNYLKYVTKLEYTETPNYIVIKQMLSNY